MNEDITLILAEMATNLKDLALNGTVTAVSTKVKAIEFEKNAQTIKNTYDEIISELLSERAEAIRLAQAYKSELDKCEISDEDITHLNNTVGKVLEILKKMSPETPIATYEQIKELISIDTLKTMQLLGFNYKAAIGDPLTQLCANAIFSKSKNSRNTMAKGRNK